MSHRLYLVSVLVVNNQQKFWFTILTEGIGGYGNEESIGYRGKGYNPNFDHADEFPPSQEHVQTEKPPVDLSKQFFDWSMYK